MFNFLRRFFSIGTMIGDMIIVGIGASFKAIPVILNELQGMFLFYLAALPHVLLFIATLGLSKAIKDMIQEHRDKKVIVARLSERQKIEIESTKRWMALREKVNVYDAVAMKAYMKV